MKSLRSADEGEARDRTRRAPRKVAIVGRANVGKSTLFNRLVGRRLALVHDQPGVTRDRREAEATLAGHEVVLIDTAGYEAGPPDSLAGRMRQQTESALAEAAVILFIVDARAGVTALDEELADHIRRSGKPYVLAANKAEGRAGDIASLEAYALGLGEPLAVSAEHAQGIVDLEDALGVALADLAAAPRAPGEDVGPAPAGADDEDEEADVAVEAPAGPIKVAVVGRPNAGKSTLINRLIGEERLLTGAEAGLTRDAISVDFSHGGQDFRLVDTAGLRRKSRVAGDLEKLSTGDAIRALKFAEIVVLVLDSTIPFEKQDLQIADLVVREGRGLVIALDKWDLVTDSDRALRSMRAEAERLLPQIAGVRVIPVSGLSGRGLDKLMAAVVETHRRWSTRISTARLNRWLAAALDRHPPPAAAGRPIKIRYMTQPKGRPPTFVAFCSRPEVLPTAYQRYLVNGLREAFDLIGVPIRLMLRKPGNPFD